MHFYLYCFACEDFIKHVNIYYKIQYIAKPFDISFWILYLNILSSFKYSLISLYTYAVRSYCQFIIIIFGSIHFVLRNSGSISIYICSLTFLVLEIVLRTFLLSLDWLVPNGKQYCRPCRCLNITQKLEVSAYLYKRNARFVPQF